MLQVIRRLTKDNVSHHQIILCIMGNKSAIIAWIPALANVSHHQIILCIVGNESAIIALVPAPAFHATGPATCGARCMRHQL